MAHAYRGGPALVAARSSFTRFRFILASRLLFSAARVREMRYKALYLLTAREIKAVFLVHHGHVLVDHPLGLNETSRSMSLSNGSF